MNWGDIAAYIKSYSKPETMATLIGASVTVMAIKSAAWAALRSSRESKMPWFDLKHVTSFRGSLGNYDIPEAIILANPTPYPVYRTLAIFDSPVPYDQRHIFLNKIDDAKGLPIFRVPLPKKYCEAFEERVDSKRLTLIIEYLDVFRNVYRQRLALVLGHASGASNIDSEYCWIDAPKFVGKRFTYATIPNSPKARLKRFFSNLGLRLKR